MNGLIRAGMADFLTAYGPNGNKPWPNDLWGNPADVDEFLAQYTDAHVYRTRDRLQAHITTANGRVFIHRTDTDQWQPPRGKSAVQSLRTLDRLANVLGVNALHYTPQTRGLSMIDFARANNPEWFERELPPNWDDTDTGVTPNFTRRMSDWKEVGNYLHKYDTRAAWLASARTAPVGFGETRKIKTWEPKTPAIWSVRLNRPVVHQAPITFSGWYATEIVRAAFERHQDITVNVGQGWAGATTALRPFCEKLIRSRNAVSTVAANLAEHDYLVDSIKRVYTRSFGALAAYRTTRPKLYQPHWYYSLRAEAARRVWRHYSNDYNPMQAYIIGIDVDTIYALAPPTIDPLTIIPNARADAWNPGTIRYEGYTPLTRQLFDMLGGRASDISDYIRERNCLNTWEGEE